MIPEQYDTLINKLWGACMNKRVSWEESSATQGRFIAHLANTVIDIGCGGESSGMSVFRGTGTALPPGAFELVIREPNGDKIDSIVTSIHDGSRHERLSDIYSAALLSARRVVEHLEAIERALDDLGEFGSSNQGDDPEF